MTSGQIVGKMDTKKQLNVPLYAKSGEQIDLEAASRQLSGAARLR